MVPDNSAARTLPFLVSTEWLATSNVPGLVMLDVRSESDYNSGHVPNSVNTPFSSWITTRNGLALELPEQADLSEAVCAAGVSQKSSVVIIGSALNPYALADAARVAITLASAGVPDVAILDGGHRKWAAEGKPISLERTQVRKSAFVARPQPVMFVSKEYVQSVIGKAVIIDSRDPEVYAGLIQEPTAARSGHIPTARCLPAPWLWTKEGTHQGIDKLTALAEGVAGPDRQQEIIVYCGVGGYAAAWCFVLTQGLGYRNVRLYDGSAQEWTRDTTTSIVSFKWE